MKLGLPAALTALAIIGSGVSYATVNANAQQAAAANAQQGAAPAENHEFEFSPADRAAFFDAKIAALHAGLKLSPDQEKLWPNVETALRNGYKNAVERFQKTKDEIQSTNLIDRLRQRGERAVARGQSLEAIADAAAPLYATLTEEQKHRLPVLFRGLRPHPFHHHFAFGGWHHEAEAGDHWSGHEGNNPAPRDR